MNTGGRKNRETGVTGGSRHKGASTAASTSSMTCSAVIPSSIAATADNSLPYCILLSSSGVVISIRWEYIFQTARVTREGVTKSSLWRGARHLIPISRWSFPKIFVQGEKAYLLHKKIEMSSCTRGYPSTDCSMKTKEWNDAVEVTLHFCGHYNPVSKSRQCQDVLWAS